MIRWEMGNNTLIGHWFSHTLKKDEALVIMVIADAAQPYSTTKNTPDQINIDTRNTLSAENPTWGRVTLPDDIDDAYTLAYLATGVDNWQNATDAKFQAASN